MNKILKLQNGSDIRGVAKDGIKGEIVNLSNKEAVAIGYAFSIWLGTKLDKNSLKISIGHDSRITASSLKASLMDGITSSAVSLEEGFSVNLYDCGLATTPSMFMSTIFEDSNCDGAIMITASHLPFNRNGFKFFTKNGGLDKKDIREILEIASIFDLEDDEIIKADKEISTLDLISMYSSHLVDIIRREIGSSVNFEKPLSGLHIIADAGNGAGGFFSEKVLEALGADTTGSQFLEPDGMFPNHEPNPENKAAMESIKEATIKTGADLGIIFDTDVDRSAVVYKGGKIINRNTLIALMSHIVLNTNPGSTIVTDSVTSDGLAEYIKARGGIHHRYMRGYKNVINESVRLNEAGTPSHLAIETSGHGAFKENYFLDDGAYIVVKTLIYLAKLKEENKELIDVLADLKEPKEELEIRVKIKLEDFKEYGLSVISDLEKLVNETADFSLPANNHEGIRVNVSSNDSIGWFLARMSLHDPVLPINIESDVEGGAEKIKLRLYNFLKKYDKLDLSGFNY